ncbi:MAG TPA: glycosyltransferase family 2 protein [Clostridia bacterium]|nr:glycosyltransferase family 2 protein [Clostridia bacterium]
MPDLYHNMTVSVIIPVYNTGKYLRETLDSALTQTYPDLEIVIVDDCSEDNSREIIKEYAARYENIIFYQQAKNRGAAVTRNKALALAGGRYVAFLDSDDLWSPEKIAKQIKFMQAQEVAFCFTAFAMINEQGQLLKGKRAVQEKINYEFLLKNTMINTSSVVLDRQKTGNLQMPLFRSWQDYATWLQLLRTGMEAYGLNEVLVKYRKRSNSLSANKFKSIPRFWNIQRNSEGLNPLAVMVNSCFFAFHALKKHYF